MYFGNTVGSWKEEHANTGKKIKTLVGLLKLKLQEREYVIQWLIT